jgi:hypothetical protein
MSTALPVFPGPGAMCNRVLLSEILRCAVIMQRRPRMTRTYPQTTRRHPARLSSIRPGFTTSAIPGVRVELHNSHDLVVSHLEKHIAFPEAIQALRFAHPFTSDLAVLASDRALVRALRHDPGHGDARAAVEFYGRVAKSTLDEAASLGWIARPSHGVTIGFATSGLLAVVDGGILRTMFFPAMRAFQGPNDTPWRNDIQLANEDPEAHYHRTVFSPAVKMINSLPSDHRVGAHSQYGALRDALPRPRFLRLEGWLSFRARRVHTEGAAV